ncbi:glycosyltransferase family 4 protein, partial [Campylobacter coli]|nr:glycosyltransferase family 4 protein [Campylobacter coli]
MKILLLIGDITIGGGAERVVINLANALFELKYNVKIF